MVVQKWIGGGTVSRKPFKIAMSMFSLETRGNSGKFYEITITTNLVGRK